jgi:FemAB-related protein (PEP-CTERM system-associated)
MADLTVREMSESDALPWDSFVHRHDLASYGHMRQWRPVIEEAYGLSAPFLVAERDGELVGVMPVAEVPTLPGVPRRAVALSYCSQGDALAVDGRDQEVRGACVEHLRQRGIRRVETRGRALGQEAAMDATMVLHLRFEDEMWRSLGTKVRNHLRRAKDSGFDLEWGAAGLEDFYGIYARNISGLGTPIHAKLFFASILKHFGALADIIVLRKDGQPIGGLLVLKHPRWWVSCFSSSLREWNALNPNSLMHWEAIRAAASAGAQTFDFGRSRIGSGTYVFKRQWGAAAVPLHYRTFVDGRPITRPATANPATALVARAWKALPFPVQSRLGPWLRPWLP